MTGTKEAAALADQAPRCVVNITIPGHKPVSVVVDTAGEPPAAIAAIAQHLHEAIRAAIAAHDPSPTEVTIAAAIALAAFVHSTDDPQAIGAALKRTIGRVLAASQARDDTRSIQ
jgi:hypothetical protein